MAGGGSGTFFGGDFTNARRAQRADGACIAFIARGSIGLGFGFGALARCFVTRGLFMAIVRGLAGFGSAFALAQLAGVVFGALYSIVTGKTVELRAKSSLFRTRKHRTAIAGAPVAGRITADVVGAKAALAIRSVNAQLPVLAEAKDLGERDGFIAEARAPSNHDRTVPKCEGPRIHSGKIELPNGFPGVRSRIVKLGAFG